MQVAGLLAVVMLLHPEAVAQSASPAPTDPWTTVCDAYAEYAAEAADVPEDELDALVDLYSWITATLPRARGESEDYALASEVVIAGVDAGVELRRRGFVAPYAIREQAKDICRDRYQQAREEAPRSLLRDLVLSGWQKSHIAQRLAGESIESSALLRSLARSGLRRAIHQGQGGAGEKEVSFGWLDAVPDADLMAWWDRYRPAQRTAGGD